MSHAVTITRTTHTTTTGTYTSITINSGYLKSIPGLLKLAELIIGALCVFLVGYNFWSHYARGTELFFFSIAVACLVGTGCLLISCLISLATGGFISKTIYELIYHSTAFITYVIASILMIVKNNRYETSHPFMMAGILGIINSILYLASTLYAHRSYKGI